MAQQRITTQTHTMEGNYACSDERGIIPRMVSSLGSAINSEQEWEFTISLIVVEIYMLQQFWFKYSSPGTPFDFTVVQEVDYFAPILILKRFGTSRIS